MKINAVGRNRTYKVKPIDLQSTAIPLCHNRLPTEGLEPTRTKPQILSLLRLPFRHIGIADGRNRTRLLLIFSQTLYH